MGQTNASVYGDNRIGDAGNLNKKVEDVERRTEEMRNDGGNGGRDGRGDQDGHGRDDGTTETAASESRHK